MREAVLTRFHENPKIRKITLGIYADDPRKQASLERLIEKIGFDKMNLFHLFEVRRSKRARRLKVSVTPRKEPKPSAPKPKRKLVR